MFFLSGMSEPPSQKITQQTTRVKTIAYGAPVIPSFTTPIVEWLETNIRGPLEGTLFDTWIATPAKEYYITAKRRD